MSQDRFQGRIFQWIKGEFEGQFERVLELKDGMLIFESDSVDSPRRIRLQVLREFMIEHGAFGGNVPVDTETGQEIPAALLPQAPSPDAPPALVGEEAVIFSLLEKQKKSEHLEIDLKLRLPIPTAEAYGFLLSTFEQDTISAAIIKKAEKDIDEQLRALATKAKADLIGGIELKYKTNGIESKGRETGVREVPQEDGSKGLQGVEIKEH